MWHNPKGRSWSPSAATGKLSIEGKITPQGSNAKFGAFVRGGPNTGYAGEKETADVISSLQ